MVIVLAPEVLVVVGIVVGDVGGGGETEPIIIPLQKLFFLCPSNSRLEFSPRADRDLGASRLSGRENEGTPTTV